jgi:hypothetical protein
MNSPFLRPDGGQGSCANGRFERGLRAGNGTDLGCRHAGQVDAKLRYVASV